MLKLYSLSGPTRRYWETWEEAPDRHVVHWGELGTRGDSKTITSPSARGAQHIIEEEIKSLIQQGFAPIPTDNHAVLLIEYAIEEMGSLDDLEKRHRLENRMNETLGWTGLGACDGGSIGSGTMEVCNFVVDFDIAKRVIEADLTGTEFADFTRIYNERAG